MHFSVMTLRPGLFYLGHRAPAIAMRCAFPVSERAKAWMRQIRETRPEAVIEVFAPMLDDQLGEDSLYGVPVEKLSELGFTAEPDEEEKAKLAVCE